MRIEMSAVTALVISSLLDAQDRQSGTRTEGSQAIAGLLYHQLVLDGGISLELVTRPRGGDFRRYVPVILSAFNTGEEKWPGDAERFSP